MAELEQQDSKRTAIAKLTKAGNSLVSFISRFRGYLVPRAYADTFGASEYQEGYHAAMSEALAVFDQMKRDVFVGNPVTAAVDQRTREIAQMIHNMRKADCGWGQEPNVALSSLELNLRQRYPEAFKEADRG